MQDPSTSADRGRMLVPALLIATVAALALWAVVTLGSTDPASAAGTTTAPAVQTQPVQDEAAPPQRDGHDCPEHDGDGSGGGGGASQAPQDEAPNASATPDV